MDIKNIKTERLCGEAMNPSHLSYWIDMGVNVDLTRTLGGPWDEKKALEKLQYNINHWNTYGYGQWFFFNNDTHELIGRCGIRNMKVDGNMEVELGYSVLPQHWKKGYATEMGTNVLEIGFLILNITNIVAFTITNNIASEKTMQKLGFVYEKKIVHESQEHVLYRLMNNKHVIIKT